MKITNYKNPHAFNQHLINSWDLLSLVKAFHEDIFLKNRRRDLIKSYVNNPLEYLEYSKES